MIETPPTFLLQSALNFLSVHAAFLPAKVSDHQNWHNSKESVWLEGKEVRV